MMMKKVIRQLKTGKFLLNDSNFCKFLKSDEIPTNERIIFTPTMLFFVLAFKDAMRVLKDDQDKSELQQVVNQHCDEDSEHWRWFLSDLQKLYQKGIISQNSVQMDPSIVWSDDYWNIRAHTYQMMYECKHAKTPFQRLLVIQVLEAAFDSFNIGMTKTIRQAGLFEELQYFGNTHSNAEDGHDGESWLQAEEEKLITEYSEISEEEKIQGLQTILRLFNTFEEMFATWYDLGKAQQKISKNFIPDVHESSVPKHLNFKQTTYRPNDININSKVVCSTYNANKHQKYRCIAPRTLRTPGANFKKENVSLKARGVQTSLASF